MFQQLITNNGFYLEELKHELVWFLPSVPEESLEVEDELTMYSIGWFDVYFP